MPPASPRLIRTALALLSALLLPACSSVFFAGLNATSSRTGVLEQRDQTFAAELPLALDVYRPPGAQALPVVVFFHGGSWKTGTRGQYAWVGRALARQGVVAVVPDYRKSPQVGLDGFMGDAARATAWAQRHAAALGGDPRRVLVMGHSAGGHIAALLATDAHWLRDAGLPPHTLCGAVGLAGPYDFLPLTDPDLRAVFGDDPAQQRRSQPVAFVDGGAPPMLLLQGDADRVVQPRNAVALETALVAAGVPVQRRSYAGVGHLGLLLALRRAPAASAPLRDALGFIRQCEPR